MKASLRRNQGLSLLEMILTITVASSLLVMAYRHYETLRRDAVAQQIVSNVDHIFEAAADYYQANCRIKTDPETGLVVGTTGKLDPSFIPAPTNPYLVTVSNLKADGFLTVPLPLVAIINNSGVGNGYIVQFNRTTPDADRSIVSSYGDTVKLGKIIVWKIQIAAEFLTNSQAQTYQKLLIADCVSTFNSASNSVYPCSAGASAGGKYVVWERLPSFASPYSNSGYWMTNASLKSFNEMYTAFPMIYLSSAPDSSYPLQNYLCGS